MAYDGRIEVLRFSRSGRVLRKTLKMKEMEEVELEESRQEKLFRQLPSSSFKTKTRYAMNNHGVHEVSWSNSGGSSPSLCPDTSVDNSFGYETESCNQQANCDSINSTHFQMKDDCSMDNSWNSESSTQESDGSTYETSYTPKSYRLKTNVGRVKCLKNMSSKRKIAKSSNSATRKSISLSISKRKNHSSRRKARKHRKGTKFNPKLLREPTRSLRKSSYVLPVKSNKNVQGAKEQFSSDQFVTSCELVDRSIALNLDRNMVRDSEQVTEHPLGIAPIDVAAHLKLLGGNLSKIGSLVAQRDLISPGVYDVLICSLFCAVGPLLCLTKEIASLEGIRDDVFVKILDHIAYIMPGLEMK